MIKSQKIPYLFLICAISLFSAVFAAAQDITAELPTPNSWRGFKLNSTNAADVLNVLGKPRQDKIEIFKSETSSEWALAKKGQAIRKLNYKKIGNFDSIEFTFVDDRLVSMSFVVNQNKPKGLIQDKSTILAAVKVPDIFKTDFLLVQKIPNSTKIADYEGQKEPNIPKFYPALYSMLGISSDSVILVTVENTSKKAIWRSIISKPTIEFFPGFVQRIQITRRGDK